MSLAENDVANLKAFVAKLPKPAGASDQAGAVNQTAPPLIAAGGAGR
jgi:hypothetical protein